MKKLLAAAALALFLILPAISQAERLTATSDSYPPFFGSDLPGQGVRTEVV